MLTRILGFVFFVVSLAGRPRVGERRLPEKIMKYRYGIPTANTPVHFHLAFAGPSGMAITWETDSDTSTHVCKYGTSSTSLTSTQTGTSRTYGTVYSHNVVIKNLEPNSKYYYSCGDATAGFGPTYSFTTAPVPGDRSPFAIAVIGDMGIRESSGVSASMIKHIDTYKWVLDVGDLGYADDYYLYLSNYEQVYADWMDEIENISSVYPFMVLPGNHEATCNEATPTVCDKSLKNFTAYRTRWRMPSDESGGTQNMWHSFDYGPIHFVQISTETDFSGAPEGPGTHLASGPFGDQITWLTNDLKAAVANRANVPWIIVSGHRPVWYSAGQDANVNKAFLPLLNQYKVDFFFSGHEHNYERYYPIGANGTACQKNYTNAACPIYFVNGAGGNVEGHQGGKGTPDYLVYRDTTDYGWARLTLHNVSTLSWEFINDNDKTVDSVTITKTV
jgi:hypothetical protein